MGVQMNKQVEQYHQTLIVAQFGSITENKAWMHRDKCCFLEKQKDKNEGTVLWQQWHE